MSTSKVLNFTEKPIIDDGIERFEYHEYEAVSTSLNKNGEIRINIEQQDLYVLPSEAYLLVEGRLLKEDGTAYAVGPQETPTTDADCKQWYNAHVQGGILLSIKPASRAYS